MGRHCLTPQPPPCNRHFAVIMIHCWKWSIRDMRHRASYVLRTNEGGKLRAYPPKPGINYVLSVVRDSHKHRPPRPSLALDKVIYLACHDRIRKVHSATTDPSKRLIYTKRKESDFLWQFIRAWLGGRKGMSLIKYD